MTTPDAPQFHQAAMPAYEPNPNGGSWPPPVAPKKSGGIARWLVPVVVGVVALLIGVGIGTASAGGTATADTTQEAAATKPLAAVTSTATVTATVTAAAATSAPPVAATSAAAPATTAAPVQSFSFPMPNEVGKNLQVAQDDVQAVSGDPLYITTSTDASGAGRMQILDSNWTVCSQSLPPGTTVTDTTPLISFGAVKIGESCP